MKRLVVYYSLSGNTKEAAEKIAKGLDADLLQLETVKAMPKSFAAQIVVGGGQVMILNIAFLSAQTPSPEQVSTQTPVYKFPALDSTAAATSPQLT